MAGIIADQLRGAPVKLTAAASAALSPGHIIEIVAAGTCRKSTLTANQPRYVAVNHAAMGQSETTAYASGDQVHILKCEPGDVVRVLCPTGLTITKELLLYLDGAGRLTTVTTNEAWARAKEAVTTSGDTLVLVELL